MPNGKGSKPPKTRSTRCANSGYPRRLRGKREPRQPQIHRGATSCPNGEQPAHTQRSSKNDRNTLQSDNPSAVVAGGVLHIDNFLETDPYVVRSVEATSDSVAEVHRLLVLGGHVSTVTGSGQRRYHLDGGRRPADEQCRRDSRGAVEGITKTAKDLLDGQDGQLPKALDGFRKEFEAMLGSSFDPDSKKSILAKFEALLEAVAKDQSKLLNAALDPHAPDSLIGRLRAEVVKTVKDEASGIGKQLGELRNHYLCRRCRIGVQGSLRPHLAERLQVRGSADTS